MNMTTRGILALALAALPAFAQQSGAITGKITSSTGAALAGIHVQVTSNLLPTPRAAVSGPNGDYRLPYLPPGAYTLLFLHPDWRTEKHAVQVLLQQSTTLNVALTPTDFEGVVVHVEGRNSSADPTSGELKTALPAEVLSSLPVGLEYRDLISLIPAVPYTQNAVRDPSAGGSGQDNIHLLDGVNVNLPMYGTVSSEPSSHDIDQIAVSKGGASAIDFNRSAGFTINAISKSGTNAFTGEMEYQTLPANLIARQQGTSSVLFNDSQNAIIGNIGGPILKEKLFFFFSYFRPTDTRENRSNAYGPMPDFSSTRDEYFGKLTYAPQADLLIHASYRNSVRTYHNQGVGGPTYAASTSDGGRVTLDISSLEAIWNLTATSVLNFKISDFANRNSDRPDQAASATPALDGSAGLNVQNLPSQGQFTVPLPAAPSVNGAAAYNSSIAPFINQYGYMANGAPAGGGSVGGYPFTSDQNFYRRNYQLSYDLSLDLGVTQDLHFGYQWVRESEDLRRLSNGWGVISMPVNVLTPNTHQAATFVAAVQQQGIDVPAIHSEYLSQNLEFNDKLRWRQFTFNVGAMVSQDQLYGQGLQEDPSTLSGYAVAPGNPYLEHEIKFKETFQPRLGVTWTDSAQNTIYATYARYVPATSSLPRGASWARNLIATVNVYFDAKGNYLDKATDTSSTGKLFVPGLKPRHTDEYVIGTTRDWGHGLTGHLFARYRYSCNFWEDTRNDSRTLFNPPPGVPRTLYIPNLTAQLTQLGVPLDPNFPNNQYVIAQLDGAFTKYYQAALELEWRGTNAFLSLSYSWSHYYGNFDQDGTTTPLAGDSNIFVGSSNLADDAGKQLWDNKYGNLAGDRRHVLKIYGTVQLPWQAKVGALAIYQSGQPWQYSSYTPYLAEITASGSTSRSDTDRYLEPAGSRVTAPHEQIDLNYTQTLWKTRQLDLSCFIDVFNLFNSQTGYDIQTNVHSANPGLPQAFFAPRRTQLGIKVLF